MTTRKAEAQFRSRLAGLIHAAGGQHTPVETAETAGPGIPDSELCLVEGAQAWLELKVHDLPKRDPFAGGKKLGHLTREQVKWLRDRSRLGGRAGLLVMARLPDSPSRRYAVLEAEHAAEWWRIQHHGDRVSWDWIRERATAGESTALNYDWIRDSVVALPVCSL